MARIGFTKKWNANVLISWEELAVAYKLKHLKMIFRHCSIVPSQMILVYM